MPGLLDLPDELLLIVQDNLITRRDRYAFEHVCHKLYKVFGRTVFYEQDVAEERDFDEARLRLERVPWTKGLPPLPRQGLKNGWAESMVIELARDEARVERAAAARAEDGGQEREDKGFFQFMSQCVDRWGPRMLCFTHPATWDMVNEDIVGFPPLPDSQRRRGRTLLYRAVRWCKDMTMLEEVFDTYLKIYPAAIQGLKHGLLDRLPETIPHEEERYELPESMYYAEDYPVYLAAYHNRVDVLELLQKKGVNINLVKSCLSVYGDDGWAHGIHRLRHDDGPGPFLHLPPHPDGGLVHHADLWTWLRIRNGRGNNKMLVYPEDACIWLIEHNLGFSDGPYSLGLRDLDMAVLHNRLRLVAAMLKHFESRLSPDEYRGALNRALRTATFHPREIGRTGQWRPPRHDPLHFHGKVFDLLLRAGAILRQDPDREEDAGLLAGAVSKRPADAIWLLRRQMAEGLTDHRDVRTALRRVAYCRYNGLFSKERGCTTAHHDFFALLYPANAHLACDPRQLATPEGRKKALNNLLLDLVRNGFSKYRTPSGYCEDLESYMEGVVGRERLDEISGRSGGRLLFGPSREEDGPAGAREFYWDRRPAMYQ